MSCQTCYLKKIYWQGLNQTFLCLKYWYNKGLKFKKKITVNWSSFESVYIHKYKRDIYKFTVQNATKQCLILLNFPVASLSKYLHVYIPLDLLLHSIFTLYLILRRYIFTHCRHQVLHYWFPQFAIHFQP